MASPRKWYSAILTFRLICFLVLQTAAAGAAPVVLPIQPLPQQTPEWCWLTVGEMVFKYYGIPAANGMSYQCGILQIAGLPCDPRLNARGGSQEVLLMFRQYPVLVHQFFPGSPLLNANWIPSSVLPQVIVATIGQRRPIPIGISPSAGPAGPGVPQHAVLIVGYDSLPTGFFIFVNDPFPFGAAQVPDPYLTPVAQGRMMIPGQYAIEVSRFANALRWSDTFDVTPR